MAEQNFCSACGAKRVAGARFCIECGVSIGSRLPIANASTLTTRYAPLFVVLCVVLAGGGTILYGYLNPTVRPAPPPRNPGAPPSGPAPSSGGMPQGEMPPSHPPIAVPDQVKDAIKDMIAKAKAAPEDLPQWKKLGEVLYRAGQIDPSYLSEAGSTYQHVLDKTPDDTETLRALGNVAYDQQHPDIAQDYYSRYLKLKPDDLDVRTDLGTMFLSNSQPLQAMREYEAVLKQDPKFFQAQFNVAIAYRSQGKTEESLAALEKAREIAPDAETKTQVEQLIAKAKGQPVPGEVAAAPHGMGEAPPAGSAPAAGAPAAAAPTKEGFQGAAEKLFRSNPIMGPKVQRIEWSGPTTAKVILKDFPMDQMGPEMKGMFGERMKGRIREQKTASNVTDPTTIELVDEASGRVMETLKE